MLEGANNRKISDAFSLSSRMDESVVPICGHVSRNWSLVKGSVYKPSFEYGHLRQDFELGKINWYFQMRSGTFRVVWLAVYKLVFSELTTPLPPPKNR